MRELWMRTLLLGGLVLALPATPASADVPPPDICEELGTSCEMPDGGAGQCQASTCTRLDYSMGTPPTSVEYDCNRCLPSSMPPPSESDSGCAASGSARALGPLALIALVWGALFIRRRRPR